MVKTYTFDDVVNALNQVVPYDWRGFWTERLTNHGPGAPLGGIEGSGWKVVYDETPSELMRGAEGDVPHVPAELFRSASTFATMEPSPTRSKAMPAAQCRHRSRHETRRREQPPILARSSARRNQSRARTHRADRTCSVENTDYYKTYKIDYHGGETLPAPRAR